MLTHISHFLPAALGLENCVDERQGTGRIPETGMGGCAGESTGRTFSSGPRSDSGAQFRDDGAPFDSGKLSGGATNDVGAAGRVGSEEHGRIRPGFLEDKASKVNDELQHDGGPAL